MAGGAGINEAQLFADPVQATWTRPKGKAACRRDPAAGPGSCWHWWDGCPDAEKRGCYGRWLSAVAQVPA